MKKRLSTLDLEGVGLLGKGKALRGELVLHVHTFLGNELAGILEAEGGNLDGHSCFLALLDRGGHRLVNSGVGAIDEDDVIHLKCQRLLRVYWKELRGRKGGKEGRL